MQRNNILEVPVCKNCGSKNIRTTKKYRICIRCGHREKIE